MSATTVSAAAAKATPFIDWTAFWKVAGISLIFGLGLVVLFSLGVLGLSMARGRMNDDEQGESGVAIKGGRGVGSVLAGTCFVLCAAAVGYGLYLEIPQFH